MGLIPSSSRWTRGPEGRLEPVPLVSLDTVFDKATGRSKIVKELGSRPSIGILEEDFPLEWRVWERWQDDKELQKLEVARCGGARTFTEEERADALFHFLTTWCVTFDPSDEARPVKRFPDWPHIKALCREYVRGGPLMVEKTRQMTVSWFFAGAFLWSLMFEPAFAAVMLSYRLDRTDDGGSKSSPESLFGKIRWIWMHLPVWLQPQLEFRHRRIQNLAYRDRYITAETASPRAGRGPTFKRALLDEAAWLDKSNAVHDALRSSCPHGMIVVSTPNGKGNILWRIKSSDTTRYTKVRLHWTLHPERRQGAYKDERGRWRSPWYDEQAADMTDAMVAQELDIDYSRSISGSVYPAFQLEHIDPTVQVDPSARIVVGWDYGGGSTTCLVWCQTADEQNLEVFDAYGMDNAGSLHFNEYYAWMMGQCQDGRGRMLMAAGLAKKFEASWGPPGRYAGYQIEHVGGPDTRSRLGPSRQSWYEQLKQGSDRLIPGRYVGGVDIQTCRTHRVEVGIDVVDWLLQRQRLVVAQTSVGTPAKPDGWIERVITAFSEYRYPTDEEGKVVVGSKPEHDEWSHWMDALRYVAVHIFWRAYNRPMSARRGFSQGSSRASSIEAGRDYRERLLAA